MGSRSRRLAGWAVVVTAVVIAAGAAALPRAAVVAPAADARNAVQTTCAHRLVRDWGDGRIDGTYPVSCYRDALRTLPVDLAVYSSAPDDIAQALSQRIVQSSTKAPVRRVAG